uniref:Uncharacterized protein n=1 Tax=Setaria viridis TaxID=4556 RepID=A0A4U6WIZ9_SETVI|nr:hypothetical protein SEVIR_1G309500v2 [Setaria viridis]
MDVCGACVWSHGGRGGRTGGRGAVWMGWVESSRRDGRGLRRVGGCGADRRAWRRARLKVRCEPTPPPLRRRAPLLRHRPTSTAPERDANTWRWDRVEERVRSEARTAKGEREGVGPTCRRRGDWFCRQTQVLTRTLQFVPY